MLLIGSLLILISALLYIDNHNCRNAFLTGWMFAFCFSSIMQDSLGLEKYIQHVKDNWVDSSYTLPISIIAMFIGMLWLKNINYKTKFD